MKVRSHAIMKLTTIMPLHSSHRPRLHPISGLRASERHEPVLLRWALRQRNGDLREALANLRSYPGLRLRHSQAERALADCLIAEGRLAEAEPLLLAAYEDIRAAQGEASAGTEDAVRALVQFYERMGKPEQRTTWAARLSTPVH